MGVLLLGVLTYVHKNYNEKRIELYIFISFFFVLLTNLSLIRAFHLTYEFSSEGFINPLVTYYIAILALIVVAIDIFINRMLHTLKKRDP